VGGQSSSDAARGRAGPGGRTPKVDRDRLSRKPNHAQSQARAALLRWRTQSCASKPTTLKPTTRRRSERAAAARERAPALARRATGGCTGPGTQAPARGTRRVRLVRGEGRGVSDWYEGEGGGTARSIARYLRTNDSRMEKKGQGPPQNHAAGPRGRRGGRREMGPPQERGRGRGIARVGGARPWRHAEVWVGRRGEAQ
jgi:hypothetical protein